MDREEIERRIKELANSPVNEDRKTWSVLYWKSKGLKHYEVAAILDRGEDWVQRYTTRTHRLFGMTHASNAEKEAFLEDEIYPVIRDLTRTDPYLFKPEPIPPLEPLEPSKGPVEPYIAGEIIHIESEKKHRILPIVTILALAGAFVVVALMAYNFGLRNRPAISEVPIIITVTYPPPTNTQLPAATLLPTNTPIPPTNTIAPTFTAAPPTPTVFAPPADGILFQDSFDGAIKPEWTPNTGIWIVSNGRLTMTADQNLTYNDVYDWITLKDVGWKNYTVFVDIFIPRSNSAIQTALVVRSSGSKEIGFTTDWQPAINLSFIGSGYTASTGISSDRGSFDVPMNTNVNVQIDVQNDTYILRTNGKEIQRVTIPGYDNSLIQLGMNCSDTYTGCPSYDNFRVTYLP